MPRVLNFITLIVAVLVTVAVAQPGQSIVGAWMQADQGTRWTFRADGTGLMERNQPKSTSRFNWQIQGNTLQLSTAGTSVPYQVMQYDGKTLVIKNPMVSQVYQLRREG